MLFSQLNFLTCMLYTLEGLSQFKVLPIDTCATSYLRKWSLSGHDKKLEDAISAARVGKVGLDNWIEILELIAINAAAHHTLARFHVVYVAPQRIDLAIVGKESRCNKIQTFLIMSRTTKSLNQLATHRNGCARSQLGNVFVEKRVCTRAR